jgi:hypothetical protein
MPHPVNAKQIAFGREANAVVAGAEAKLVISALKLLDITLAACKITGHASNSRMAAARSSARMSARAASDQTGRRTISASG